MPAMPARSSRCSRGHRITVSGVMSAPDVDPGRAGGLEIRQAFPERAGHRQPRQGLRGLDRPDLVNDEPETIAQVDDRGVERRPGRGIEDQSHRVFLAADSQGMNFQARFAFRDRFVHLQHVGPKHQMPIGVQVLGVIFHERRAAGQVGGDGLHDPHRAAPMLRTFT